MQLAADPDATPTLAQWRRGVAGVLAKARKVDPAELPADPERLLAVHTYDGLTVAPLYTRIDERPEAALPGVFPYLRGREATRDVRRGWHVNADIAAADGATANQDILAALAAGSTSVRLVVGSAGVPVAEVATALAGVLFDLAPVALSAGPDADDAADCLFAVLDRYSCPRREDIVVSLGAAPLTSAFAGIADRDATVAAATALARRAAERAETVRALTVDGTVFHNAGASDAQELGASIAAGLAYLRGLTAAGLGVADALGQLEFRLAASDDQFQTIAKFRAARQLWARVGQVCGAPEAAAAPQHAVTSAAMLTRRDPWVNLLRGTLAAFGAGVGGADSVTVLPFDAALAPGALGVSAAFSQRMARNTQLLLLEESHLGRVLDPGAGSWYVDDLTAKIAAKAWEFMQEIERAGGYACALDSGALPEWIDATRSTRDRDIAHRRTTVTGVNEFPNLAEPVTAPATDSVARYSGAFDALRDRSDAYLAARGARPTVRLVPLGPLAENNVRVTFASNLLASGGIEAVDAGGDIAVLCGSDKRYGAEAADAVRALRAEGVRTVLLAGPESAVGDATGPARPDGFLTMRIDAVAALSDLLGKLGA
jgi:methylmalonyl-CoA mutase